MKKLKLRWMAALAALTLSGGAWAAVVGELEGVPVEDSATVAGTKLVLNGAAVRKRGYFKTDVTALYLPAHRKTLDGVYKIPGPKRIQLSVLRDLSGSIIARYFLSDFKLVTTDEEFKSLITEVGQIGDLYGRLGKVNKGDVVTVDWVPGKGIRTELNGKALMTSGGTSEYMNSPLMYEILLRMYIGERATSDYRNGLLGLENHFSNTALASESNKVEPKTESRR